MLIFDLILATRRPAMTGIERYGVNLFKAVRRLQPDSIAFVHDLGAFDERRGLIAVPNVYSGWINLPIAIRHQRLAADAVIFPTAPASPFFLRCNVRLCRIVHDVFPWVWERAMPWKGRLLYRYGENLMVRRYDHLLGTTEAVAKDMRALFGRADIGWCGNAPGLDLDGPEQRPEGVPETFILVVGTVEPRKGYAQLVDLVENAPDEAPPVVLVGRPGWGGIVARVEELAARKPSRFVWLRDQKDDGLRWLSRRAKCFLTLSLAEGFNMPLVENAICGRPILCSDIPVHRAVAPPWSRFIAKNATLERLWVELCGAASPSPEEVAAYRSRYSWESVAQGLLNVVTPAVTPKMRILAC